MYGVSISFQPLSRPEPFLFPGRVMDLHSHVHPDDEEVEVESDAESPVCRYTFCKCLPCQSGRMSFSAALPECPHVSGIDKCSSCHFPEEREPVFDICLQFQVSCLVGDEEGLIRQRESRPDSACLPASQAVCPSGIEMFVKREGCRIAVCISRSCKQSGGDGLSVAPAESPGLADCQLRPDILALRSVPYHSGSGGILCHKRLESAEDIAGNVKLEP